MLQLLHPNEPLSGRFTYEIDSLNEDDIRADLSQFWPLFLSHVSTFRPDGTWDRILFECWIDQGYLLAYPNKRGDSLTKRVPEVILGFAYFASAVAEIDRADEEEMADELLANAFEFISKRIAESCRIEPARSALNAALVRNSFVFQIMQDGDVETLSKVDLRVE